MLMAFINVAVFLVVLFVGFVLGSNNGYKEALRSFQPVIDAVSTILKGLDENEKEGNDEMSVDEDHESVC